MPIRKLLSAGITGSIIGFVTDQYYVSNHVDVDHGHRRHISPLTVYQPIGNIITNIAPEDPNFKDIYKIFSTTTMLAYMMWISPGVTASQIYDMNMYEERWRHDFRARKN